MTASVGYDLMLAFDLPFLHDIAGCSNDFFIGGFIHVPGTHFAIGGFVRWLAITDVSHKFARTSDFGQCE